MSVERIQKMFTIILNTRVSPKHNPKVNADAVCRLENTIQLSSYREEMISQ